MKQIIPTILFIISISFIGCDKIEPPYTQNNSQLAERTVLIEKFTGHKCSNCPEASRTVDELKEFYGDNLISVAIHPGNLTEFTSTDDNYPYDFATDASDTIGIEMGATFLPLGSVNRINGGISNRCFTKNEWGIQINNLLYDSNGLPLPKNIEMEINTSFNEKNKELTIQTNFTYKNSIEKNHSICIFIMEDAIISPQIDGSEYVEDYEHNHIYRCAVNRTYGESIEKFHFVDVEGQSDYQSTHTIVFSEETNINWTDDWNNINNCYVVAYVYNNENLTIEHTIKHKIINE